MVSVYDIVAAVKDPELPIITIAELGVLRDVSTQDGRVTVTITPTYSGCPAMDAIRQDIRGALAKAGHPLLEAGYAEHLAQNQARIVKAEGLVEIAGQEKMLLIVQVHRKRSESRLDLSKRIHRYRGGRRLSGLPGPDTQRCFYCSIVTVS